MSNFYDAWNQEETREQTNSVRKDRIGDTIDRFLRSALKVDDTDVFTMSKARQLYEKMLSDRPLDEQLEDMCAMSIKRSESIYVITLVLIDKNKDPVRMTTKSYYGYQFKAKYIDETVAHYMGGQNSCIMPNPNNK